MTKLVVLYPSIQSRDPQIEQSFNNDVRSIVYSLNMTGEEFLAQVGSLSNITHLAFLYHFPGYDKLPFFNDIPDTSNYLTMSKYRFFSDSVISVFKAIRDGRVDKTNSLIVDLLSCDMKSTAFYNEVQQVQSELSIIIRYSLDKTGNPQSGANWVLESVTPPVNIKDTYFTDNILQWNGVLTTDISTGIKSGSYSAYITWNGATSTYTVVQDFNYSDLVAISSDSNSYILLNAGETFDGNNHTIDISGYLFDGLLAMSGSISNSDVRPVVKNIGILNGITSFESGFIVRGFQSYCVIQNCYSTGGIGDSQSGGIIGCCAGIGGKVTISKCYSTGQIGLFGYAIQCGGIAGLVAGVSNGLCEISDCYSTGNFPNPACGGIVGSSPGYDNGSCIITNCYSTGLIGFLSGGITAAGAGNTGHCEIYNCYSSGSITERSGGIAGNGTAVNAGYCKISNCYSKGNITTKSGGISADEVSTSGGTCEILNCYSLGSIGDDCGGIVGNSSATAGTCTITNCYSTGSIVGTNAGGICGSQSGGGGSLTVIKCVSNSPTSGTGSTITANGNSTNISVINNSLYTSWSSSVWVVGLEVVSVSNYKLPILGVFQASPWISISSDVNYYKSADLSAQFDNSPPEPPVIPCFMGNALIETPSGLKKIEQLNEGDEVITYERKVVKIQRIEKTIVNPSFNTNPFIIPIGTFKATKELLLSPEHKIWNSKQWVKAKDLGLRQKSMTTAWTYYNIELPNWESLRVHDVIVESLAPVRTITMSVEQFCRQLVKQYGKTVLTNELLNKLRQFEINVDSVKTKVIYTRQK